MKRLLLILTCLLPAAVAAADNIDLVTVPPRREVQLTIYNSEDLTLVRERRAITFNKGLNRLQFSWANTLIDPTSVHFSPMERQDELEVLDTTFPGTRPQVLVWNVESEFDGEAMVEVSYFTSGISWAADYVMITDPDETEMSFEGFVTVTNKSGEDYEGAEIRLVVGVVNLVEEIERLARGDVPPQPGTPAYDRLRPQAMRARVGRAEMERAPESRAPEVVKEGLSEYFIFTVEGVQTVPHGWSQRMQSFRAEEVPFEILYRYRPHQYGPRPKRFFILANDEEHNLGDSPLPDGVIRVFRRNERDGLGFYTSQNTRYIPIRADLELNVGTDDQVVYERDVTRAVRSALTLDAHGNVRGWNERRTWREEIRNYRDRTIRMEIRHNFGNNDVSFLMPNAEELLVEPLRLFDNSTVEYTVEVPPARRQVLISRGLFRLGRNQRREGVTLLEPDDDEEQSSLEPLR